MNKTEKGIFGLVTLNMIVCCGMVYRFYGLAGLAFILIFYFIIWANVAKEVKK